MKKEKVMRNKTFPQTGADRHPEMAEVTRPSSRHALDRFYNNPLEKE